jgi:hypothetical protein
MSASTLSSAVQALQARPTTLSVRLTNICPHDRVSRECCGNAEWMRVIWRINELCPGSFAEPIETADWQGRTSHFAEEYASFRVLIGSDTSYIQALTPEAMHLLRLAVLQVSGMLVDDNGQCRLRVDATHPSGR